MQDELAAVTEFLGKLEEMCVAKPDTYEERTQRREAEVAGLKEALNVLSGEGALLQRRAVSKRAWHALRGVALRA